MHMLDDPTTLAALSARLRESIAHWRDDFASPAIVKLAIPPAHHVKAATVLQSLGTAAKLPLAIIARASGPMLVATSLQSDPSGEKPIHSPTDVPFVSLFAREILSLARSFGGRAQLVSAPIQFKASYRAIFSESLASERTLAKRIKSAFDPNNLFPTLDAPAAPPTPAKSETSPRHTPHRNLHRKQTTRQLLRLRPHRSSRNKQRPPIVAAKRAVRHVRHRHLNLLDDFAAWRNPQDPLPSPPAIPNKPFFIHRRSVRQSRVNLFHKHAPILHIRRRTIGIVVIGPDHVPDRARTIKCRSIRTPHNRVRNSKSRVAHRNFPIRRHPIQRSRKSFRFHSASIRRHVVRHTAYPEIPFRIRRTIVQPVIRPVALDRNKFQAPISLRRPKQQSSANRHHQPSVD